MSSNLEYSGPPDRDSRIYVAGHRGLAGSALVRRLESAGYRTILTRSHPDLDLTDQRGVRAYFEQQRPEYVFLAAAKVGGILANDTYPADFIYANLAIQTNVIHECWRAGVRRLIFLGSSCIYPRDCPQPMKEEYLLTGPLEPTNRPYAVAKIAGIEMCRSYNRQYGTRYLAVMPTNLYGPGDNYDLQASHVIPALIRKMHEAKVRGERQAVVWGTGTPRREFLLSDDMADACMFLMSLSDERFPAALEPASLPLFNIGCGEDLTIRELAEAIGKIVGFGGQIVFDSSKPDGAPRKLMDTSRLAQLGWKAAIPLDQGLRLAYADYLKHRAHPEERPYVAG
ncbi:MAG: GDP-L-fucose synthase [Betaproteobacteria bacterium]|nr:GDP-L-fucose synthase [Betaproteobacteria bacterium]